MWHDFILLLGGHLRKFLLFYRWKAEISTWCIGGNWLALGSKPVGVSLEYAILPPEAFLQVISQWLLELHRLEIEGVGRNKYSSFHTPWFTRINVACSVHGQDGSSEPASVGTERPLGWLAAGASWSLWGEASVSDHGVLLQWLLCQPKTGWWPSAAFVPLLGDQMFFVLWA